MIRHVILWKLKELSPTEKESVKQGIKEGLEGLVGQIEGLLSVRVEIRGLPSSCVDLMLDSTFADEASLLRYSSHPLHVAVAESKVRPYTAVRSCFDYEV
ncbi:MAG: Dabb family protein [Christensenellaceae bacterium]